MPFIEAAVGGAQESEAVTTGRYPLRVSKADIVKVKNNNPDGSKQQVAIVIDIMDASIVNPAPVYLYLGLPHKDDDARTANRKLLAVARFCRQFGVPYDESGFNTDDFVGATCDDGQLEQEPVKNAEGDETGEVRNVLRLDRLPSEAAEQPQQQRRRARR